MTKLSVGMMRQDELLTEGAGCRRECMEMEGSVTPTLRHKLTAHV